MFHKTAPVVHRYKTLKDDSDASGQDTHSVLVDYDTFMNVSMPDKTDPQHLYKPDGLDFRLKPGSAAIDAGVELPSITDGFTGRAPDIGAFETGRPLPHYGPRNERSVTVTDTDVTLGRLRRPRHRASVGLMGRNVAILLTTVVCFCTAASSAYAHHSHGMFYDPCTNVTIDGRIDAVQWKNPHILIDVRATDGATVRAEWIGLQGLANRGDAGSVQEALKVGERVIVTGNPLRDAAAIRASFPAYKEPADKMKVIDVTQIRHASDSWNWSIQAPATSNCAQK